MVTVRNVIRLELVVTARVSCLSWRGPDSRISCEGERGHDGYTHFHYGRGARGQWFFWGHAGRPGYDPGTLARVAGDSDTEAATGFAHKPTEWTRGIASITINEALGIYAGFVASEPNPWVWHWCADTERWLAAGTRNHTLGGVAPLTLSPSLLFDCCGLHGYIRAGQWVVA